MSKYVAHVITSKAQALGKPEIIVMTKDEGTGAEEIMTIQWRLVETDQVRLAEHGWRTLTTVDDYVEVEPGYYIVDVEPANWDKILETIGSARDAAEVELERRELAWRIALASAPASYRVYPAASHTSAHL